jgi:hypothetical protein
MFLILFMLMLCGCTGSPEADTPLSCDEIEASLERDTCFGEMVLAMTASEADKVEGIGGQIQDGMVRQAAISRWVADHANEIPKETGESLCKMLGGRDQSYCLKRFLAVHLQR